MPTPSSKAAEEIVLYPDATDENADWPKVTRDVDIPTGDEDNLAELLPSGMTAAQFRKLPAYTLPRRKVETE